METTRNEHAPKRRPKWWKQEYDSTWERVKAAFRRDWDQAPEKEDESWEDVEEGFRFGHAARAHFGDRFPTWNDDLATKLEREWKSLETRRTWEARRYHIRRGYDQPFIA